MTSVTGRISPQQFHEATGTGDWRVIGEGACAHFGADSFAAGARLVAAIAELSGLGDHHPDVDLRFAGVTVRLISLAAGGRLVDDTHAPSFRVLADAEGNEACVSTTA
jgi:4a-hydroxytetrahydrobiopterin dehydratase